MVLTVHLIRHAPHGDVGERLSGRAPGRPLTDAGARCAQRLGAAMRDEPLAAVHASPLERTMQTASMLAGPHGLDVEPVEALNEIDFGEWTGQGFATLAEDPRWQDWNARRAQGRCPGGERAADAQQRIVEHLFSTAATTPSGAVAMVTHCDMIRAAVAYVLGLSLDRVDRFEVSPASISEIAIEGESARLVHLNQRVE